MTCIGKSNLHHNFRTILEHAKGRVSPAGGCDLVSVKLEKVHVALQGCFLCALGMVFCNITQYRNEQ